MKCKFSIIQFLLVFVIGVFSSCSKKEELPNVVLVLVDDMGYGDPQCYVPESKIPTPNIDQLADEGIRFTDAHSPSSVCTPTRYSILTGRYAWRTYLKKGVLGPYSKPLIEDDRLTLPKMLKEKGYNTALVGKWHLGMQWGTKNGEPLPVLWERDYDLSKIDHSKPITAGPLTAGFDYHFGVDVPNFPPYLFMENGRLLGNPTIPKPKNMYGNAGMMIPGWKLEDILPKLTEKAVAYIDGHAKSNSTKPFFLQLTTTSPHTPIVPAENFVGKSQAGPYGDLVHQTDYTLGEVMKALKRNRIEKNTIVIFTSDNGSPERAGDPHTHGPEFQTPGSVKTMFGHDPNAPLRGMKADIYEGGHRVPFIVKWPEKFKANTVSNETICAVDIMATLASVVNYNLSDTEAEDSYNLLPLFMGEKVGVEKTGNTIREATIHHSVNGSFAIRKGKWKMIPQKGNGGWTHGQSVKEAKNEPEGQLYNMETDAAEQNNLWQEYPEVVEELNSLLEKYKNEGSSVNR